MFLDSSAGMESPKTTVLFFQKSNPVAGGRSDFPTSSAASTSLSWLQMRMMRRQKLVLQSVFLFSSLLGISSSFGCTSRKSPLTCRQRVSSLDPGSFGSFGSGIKDPGLVGSRIRLTEDQRRPEREGSGAGWGSILRVIVHFFCASTNKQKKRTCQTFSFRTNVCPKMVF